MDNLIYAHLQSRKIIKARAVYEQLAFQGKKKKEERNTIWHVTRSFSRGMMGTRKFCS